MANPPPHGPLSSVYNQLTMLHNFILTSKGNFISHVMYVNHALTLWLLTLDLYCILWSNIKLHNVQFAMMVIKTC